MTKLYSIGTILVTKRPSQMHLYTELFGGESISFIVESILGDIRLRLESLCDTRNRGKLKLAEVTVTEENQKWLSPEILPRDVFTKESRYLMGEMGEICCAHPDEEIGWVNFKGNDFDPYDLSLRIGQIISRLYPNGQRAPLIEFDEVVEPRPTTPSPPPFANSKPCQPSCLICQRRNITPGRR